MGVVRSRLLVGRDEELAVLREARSLADSGRPALVVVEGEAGIGKTRMVRELADEVTDSDPAAVVATGHGVNLAVGAVPYGAAASLFQDLVLEVGEKVVDELLGRHSGALDPLLHGLGGAQDGDVLDRLALFGATQRLLALLSRDRLLCLFVEDLHWADASSLDLLLFLVKAARPGRLLIVVTVRPVQGLDASTAGQVAELVRSAAVPVVRLGPLSADQVRDQAQDALSGSHVDEDLLRQVERLSDGVPLYVEELLAAAVGNGHAPTLPSTLKVMLTARVEGMSEDVVRTLQAASVVERAFETDVLARVLRRPRDPVGDELAEGVSAGVLDELATGQHRFHHALLRQALSDSLTPSARAGWHRAWAEVLAADGSGAKGRISEVANHWYLADDADRALASAVAAAEVARASAAPREAAAHLARALETWPRAADPEQSAGADRDTLLTRLVEDLEDSEEYDRILEVVADEKRMMVGFSPLKRFWLLVTEANAAFQVARDAAVPPVDELERRVRDLEREPASEMLLDTAKTAWSVIALKGGDFDDAAALSERVAAELDRPGTRAILLNLRALAAEDREDFVASGRLAAEAMVVAENHQPTEYLEAARHASLSAWTLGRLHEATEIGEAALERVGSPLAEPGIWRTHASVVAEAHRLLGHYEKCSEVYASLDELPPTLVSGASLAGRSWVAAVRGRFDRADELLRRALETIPALGSAGSSVNWTGIPVWAAATILLEQGSGPEAFALLRPVLEHPFLNEAPRFSWVFVLAAAQALPQGDDSAAGITRDAAGTVTHIGPVGTAWSTEVEAHLQRASGVRAPNGWQAAADAWGHLSMPLHEASCLLQLADAELDSRACGAAERHNRARTALVRARSLASDIGAAPLVARIDALARSARIRLGPGQEQAVGSPLTERETHVLGLLVKGRTNEQIGAALYMSPKTASVHVSRIIAKLGAANRTEVVGLAHRLGLLDQG